MYIGEIAELTGCTPKAIRLYERLGLIPQPKRRGNYRVYTDYDVKLVRSIRAAQAVGFKLSELGTLIKEKIRQDRFPLELANQLIEVKRLQVRQQIATLEYLDVRLVDLKHELNLTYAQEVPVQAP